MPTTRYHPSRTLTRRLSRLPGEDRSAFRDKVARLRQHFEAFNIDTAELCQWLMGLRKRFGDTDDPASFGVLGDFLLEPKLEGRSPDEGEADRWRLAVFDHVAGFRHIDALAGSPLPGQLVEAMTNAKAALTPTARNLFERLASLDPAHRMILLKAAAEWVVARYRRGVENWLRQRSAWEQEKAAWEQAHPKLTPELRDRFTKVFKSLTEPEEGANELKPAAPGVRRKNPRICTCERLKANIDNCVYAGEKGHGPLCWKFARFVNERKATGKFNKKKFVENANRLLAYCHEQSISKPANVFLSPKAADLLFKDAPAAQRPFFLKNFKQEWTAYLAAMNLTQEAAARQGCLRHCDTIGNEIFQKSKCPWNPHTKLCEEYRRKVNAEFSKDPALLDLEKDYRQWRSLYLAGPRKPSFKYPSARELPMPKIFGDRFYEVDFERSILRLRLEDMREGEWLEFGFTPWPRGYSPDRRQIVDRLTSVHIQFSGSRVRVGFHFEAPFAPSRIGVSQDELDDLRSRVYPRQAQDQAFVEAAREKIVESFEGEAEKSLRMLTVDMGMSGAHAAVYEGRRYKTDTAIKIDKVEKLYDAFPAAKPMPDAPKQQENRNKGGTKRKKQPHKDKEIDPALEARKIDSRGLRKEHVGRHLTTIARGAAELAEYRAKKEDELVSTLRAADFRGLKRHIAWMARDWARLNTSQIIKLAEEHGCDLIVFESLRGKRLPAFDQMGDNAQHQKQEALLYAYGRVRRKVTEKAVERGMRVVTAPYHCSSKVCSVCGRKQENGGLWRKNKSNKQFICEHKSCPACGKPVDSDANAARVIGEVFWSTITLPEPT